jgi:uncharacterized protein DUF4352
MDDDIEKGAHLEWQMIARKGTKVMFLQQKKLMPAGMILALFLLLVACSSVGSNSSTGNTGAGSTTITPQLVTSKAASGSPGKGPLVISSPTPLPGGKAGSQQIVLGDRTLIINSVSERQAASTNSTSIDLDLAVQNTSAKAIMNRSTFFQLMGPDGDAFGFQYNSSDNFYGTIAAHATRSGTIEFEVPTAPTSSLRLLYRPEIATETAIFLLNIS